MAYKQMFRDSMTNNVFEDRHGHAGQKARVSFNKTDNVKISTEKLQPANVNKRLVLNEPTALTRYARAKIEMAERKESDMRISALYRPSSRIERLAMPLPRWRKPLVRLAAVSKSKLKNYDNNKNLERIIYLPKIVNRKLSRLSTYHLKWFITIDLILLDKCNERIERVTT